MNARSRVKLYWTTDPSYLGYNNYAKPWDPQSYTPNLVGTPKTILDKWEREKIRAGLNGGTYFAVAVFVDGKRSDLDEVRDFVRAKEIGVELI